MRTTAEQTSLPLSSSKPETKRSISLTSTGSIFTARQVAGALRAMKSERACGLDHWTPGNWLNLLIEAREGVASILSV